MTDQPSIKSPRLPSVVRYIIRALLTVVLGIGCCYLLYLAINLPYISGNFVASQAQARVDPIYRQVLEIMPSEATLINEEEPQSGSYSFALSDGAPQYAYVRARQSYSTTLSFRDVLAIYEDRLRQWGWNALPLNSDSGLISAAFSDPNDENLIVGLCTPPETSSQYVVFLDFDETPGCEGRNGRLGCISSHYCEGS